MDIEALAAALGPVIKEALAKATAPLLERLDAAEKRFPALEAAQKTSSDEAGAEIARTKTEVLEAVDRVTKALAEAVAPVVRRLDGVEGSVERVEELTATVRSSEETAAIARAELEQRFTEQVLAAGVAGTKEALAAARAEFEEVVDAKLEALPKPENGKDADVEAVLEQARAAAEETVVAATAAAVPKMIETVEARVRIALPELVEAKTKALRDLVDEAGPAVAAEARAAIAKAAEAIPKPKDGADGRDAAHLEILPALDEEKSYPRGTFAIDRGGLWRSFETTSGRRGWECIVEGFEGAEIDYDDELRACTVSLKRSSGAVVERTFHLPTLIHRGVWKAQAYTAGDTVQKDGHLWIAAGHPIDTDEPGTSSIWQLAVRRGRDGKSDIRAAALSPVRLAP